MTILEEDISEKNQIKLISVSQAIRKHFGRYRIKGTITGISRPFKMISKLTFYCADCSKLTDLDFLYPFFNLSNIFKQYDTKCDQCNRLIRKGLNPGYRNAVIIEIQDSEMFNEIDRLSVFLFDNDTEDIQVGEMVTIIGNIQILEGKRYFNFLYAESIQYLNREDFSLTNQDIEAIKRFRNIKGEDSIIDALVSLFDTSVVGYEHVKKGILCAAVNTSTEIEKSEHLDELFIGPPGLAKTKLLKRATELVPGSSMESAQNSSGKSITAIIEKTDDNTFLRLGAIPRARGAFCGLNEIGRMSIEDQGHLLDVMQEREFTINKHGIHARILSPTSIIGSANPINRATWKDNDKIDLNEFPILEPIIDRIDLIFVFKKRKSKPEVDEFVDRLCEVEDKKDKNQLPNYSSFLIKYIQYAKKFNTILTDEARTMLKEFYKEISIKDFGSPRILITLFNLTKAIARLKLKDLADEQDAKEAMEFYNVMLVDFQKSVVISQPPKDIAYQKCVTLLKEVKESGGITVEELIKQICFGDEQLAYYFGYNKKSFNISYNH